jgi:hypothetical protein
LRHFASQVFWENYRKLPDPVRKLADKNFELLKSNAWHPSLRFKKIGRFFSARVGLSYRVLGVEVEGAHFGFGSGATQITIRSWADLREPRRWMKNLDQGCLDPI